MGVELWFVCQNTKMSGSRHVHDPTGDGCVCHVCPSPYPCRTIRILRRTNGMFSFGLRFHTYIKAQSASIKVLNVDVSYITTKMITFCRMYIIVKVSKRVCGNRFFSPNSQKTYNEIVSQRARARRKAHSSATPAHIFCPIGKLRSKDFFGRRRSFGVT